MTPIEQAAQALRESRRIVADALEAFGPCDHSVGICNCDMRRSIEQSDAALASLDAAKQEPLTNAVFAYVGLEETGLGSKIRTRFVWNPNDAEDPWPLYLGAQQ